MAEKRDDESIRREALRNVEEGRVEIDQEIRALKEKLNPAHAARRLVKEHPIPLYAAAAVSGLLVAWLLFPRKHPLEKTTQKFTPSPLPQPASPARHLGMLALKTGIPFVVRSLIKKALNPAEVQTNAPDDESVSGI